MYLAQAFRLKSRVATDFNMADNSNLKAWYKYNTGLTLDGNEIDEWADSSNNATNMDLTPISASNITRFISGNVVFSTANKSYLQSANQLNLGQFTIFGVMDFNEAVTLSNEVMLGRLANDAIKFFRGASNDRVGLRANGVNYEINPLSAQIPTGKFLFEADRDSSGTFTVYFNELAQGNVSTDVANLLDFNQLGYAVLDSNMNEVAIYDTYINPSSRGAIRNDIKTRNGL